MIIYHLTKHYIPLAFQHLVLVTQLAIVSGVRNIRLQRSSGVRTGQLRVQGPMLQHFFCVSTDAVA